MERDDIIKNLKPIEKLYFISKEKGEVYDKKNILFCVIYQLVENKNLHFNKKLKISYSGNDLLRDYENEILNYIDRSQYLQLDKFLETIVFNKTLIDNNILKLDLKKKSFLLFFNKEEKEFVKTQKYYELYAEMLKEIEKLGNNTLFYVCPNKNIYSKCNNIYNYLKNKIIEENNKEQKKRPQEQEILKDIYGKK